MYSQQDDEFPEYGCLEHDWGISNEPCPYCTEDDLENSVWLNGVRLGKATEISGREVRRTLADSNARLRALLRELVEGQNRPGHWCTYCGEYQAGTYSSHDGHGVIIKHTDDCPVARARAEVGGDE